jgi:hypothetical protein
VEPALGLPSGSILLGSAVISVLGERLLLIVDDGSRFGIGDLLLVEIAISVNQPLEPKPLDEPAGS